MMPGTLQTALGVTVVHYGRAVKPDGPPLEAVIAQAIKNAMVAATEEAGAQLATQAGGHEVDVLTTSLMPHVTPDAVIVACLIAFAVRPLILDAP